MYNESRVKALWNRIFPQTSMPQDIKEAATVIKALFPTYINQHPDHKKARERRATAVELYFLGQDTPTRAEVGKRLQNFDEEDSTGVSVSRANQAIEKGVIGLAAVARQQKVTNLNS